MGYNLTYAQEAEKSKLVFGIYIGALIANQHTANMYDGYGFDIDGNKNSYANSWMNQKINIEYSGAIAGTQDIIAEQLKVDYNTWSFTQADMAKNMRYNPAFNIGLNMKYSVDENNAIIMNVNAAKLIINGNFNINTVPQANSTQINTSIRNFSIIGGEQRLILQFGYQHVFAKDKDSRFSPLVEVGINATAAKFNQNFVIIENLNIDLLSYNNSVFNTSALPVRRPIGIGFGGFGGLGINIKTDGKYSAQVVYNPSFEQINIGPAPELKMQNAIGLRFYYNF
jgi:hypothetical protein